MPRRRRRRSRGGGGDHSQRDRGLTIAGRKPDAFEAGLKTIGRRERSTADVVEWLAGRDYGPEEIEEAVNRLIEEGLLDDDRFARLFAEDKRDLAGWGPERIAAGLRDHGVDRRLIEQVCEASYDEQVERAAELLGLRDLPLDDDPARDRALGFLTRRGYGYEVSHDAIRRAEQIAAGASGGAGREAA